MPCEYHFNKKAEELPRVTPLPNSTKSQAQCTFTPYISPRRRDENSEYNTTITISFPPINSQIHMPNLWISEVLTWIVKHWFAKWSILYWTDQIFHCVFQIQVNFLANSTCSTILINIYKYSAIKWGISSQKA